MERITDWQCSLLADVLYNELLEVEPDQWSDYEGTLSTFCQLASLDRLEWFLKDSRNEVERGVVAAAIERRRAGE